MAIKNDLNTAVTKLIVERMEAVTNLDALKAKDIDNQLKHFNIKVTKTDNGLSWRVINGKHS